MLIKCGHPWSGEIEKRAVFVKKLSAVAVTARQMGGVDDEAALRDAVLLTRPGDDVGPAGRIGLALAGNSARGGSSDEASVVGVLDALGLARDDETAADLADELTHLAATHGTVGTTIGTFAAVERRGLPRTGGSWFADALLVQRLGWPHAGPAVRWRNRQ
ncbi:MULTISPECIES: DUF1403 family protein [unclassified Mesorhizobium]|uniref:DUF1403 family protein n=1 Tax=unclassified Mesorhizobium TaxID=325217 RepID=UPI001CCF63A6|nr:DUF1403 family protein [Mesorhizobium sp. BR1-1-7]MBZ9952816.1 DUF1403 family protein [Mesorhizobium sp. BR1-1-15]MBZ9972657.1 DUF1403 family protein [Mesorhizobium sp. BR1-1-12]